MLGKLFKYEFKACARVIFPVFGAAIIMSILAARLIPLASNDMSMASQTVITALVTLVLIIFMFALFASMLLSFIFAIRRFKSNLLGKEGYLMNTLPVSTFSNVAAKLLCSLVFQTLSVAVAAVSIWFLVILSNREYIAEAFEEIGDVFRALMALDAMGWLNFILMIVLLIIGVIKSYSMIYAAMSMGYSFNSHKGLISIGLFIAFTTAESLITNLINAGSNQFRFESTEAYHNAVMLATVSSIIISAIFAAIYTSLTTFFLKRRLNLE